MKFDSLPLAPQLIEAAALCDYQVLTPVQEKVIPVALRGGDLMACAETGTGKTAAFGFPLLNALMNIENSESILRGLILTPTRELAIQVAQHLTDYAQQLSLKVLAVYGGANINPQRKALAQGVDVLVATPGRLFDLIGQHGVSLANVNYLIVDEADRMLDLGFVKDIEKTKALVAENHQTMLFSATYSDSVRQLSNKMLLAPEWINITERTGSARIEQFAYVVDKRRKAEMLSELIGRNNWQQVMVFVSTKESAEHLTKELKLDGIKASVFHGDKTQGARNRALEDFKSGGIKVLVATDVAARGLDIQALPLVINFELPFAVEDYVHRIGRTGRAGLSGTAISFLSPNDEAMMKDIEAEIGFPLTRKVVQGYELGAPLPERYRQLTETTTSSNKANKQTKAKFAKNRSGSKKSKSTFKSPKSAYGSKAQSKPKSSTTGSKWRKA